MLMIGKVFPEMDVGSYISDQKKEPAHVLEKDLGLRVLQKDFV